MNCSWSVAGWRTARLLSALSFVLVLAASAFPASAQERSGALAQVKRWGYQLQNLDLNRLAGGPHDLLVIDYSRDGTEEEALKPADLAKLKRKPDGGRRLVVAYLSIGEAETYRDYWRWYWGGRWYTRWIGWFLAPSWLGPEDKSWRGNYAVRYWQPGWQDVILGKGGYVDRLIAQGFDGVYLDKINSSIEAIAKDRPSARDDMRAFVRAIAEKGRAMRKGFIVIPQNGEELLTDEAYASLIDGIGKEDLLFGEFKEKQANPENAVARRTAELKLAAAKHKTVLAVEYLDDPEKIAAARSRLEALGFVPNFSDRELTTLRYGDTPDTARGGK